MDRTVVSNETRIPAGKSEVWAYTLAALSCGHAVKGPRAVGEVMDCERCTWNAEARATIEEAARSGQLSHTRASRFGMPGVDAYVYDPTMPRGVRHLVSLEDTPETHAFLRSLSSHLTPLSPTEAR